ncbi:MULTISPECIES: response regulator transcription factor [Sphingomonas]|uniref:response regulator transcription factor n=1 Tax=Sphingomonas TaxID=13687 RepID=UPI002412E79E|nr:response regulator transcription factor [Sphingomonas echinoides]
MKNVAMLQNEGDLPCAIVASGAEIFRFAISDLMRRRILIDKVYEASNWSNAQYCLAHSSAASLIIVNSDVIKGQCHTTLRSLRLAYPQLRIVVIGQSQERMKILALVSAGAHAYVLETTPMDEIARAIHMVVSGHIYLPDSVANLSVPEQSEDRSKGLLTRRQEQVLELLVDGASTKEIAYRLKLSEGTIKVHLCGLYKALGVHSRAGAVASVHARAY